jgi:peptidoglycan/xylan/chitin deacetylase (PgdA/CDA1 family)
MSGMSILESAKAMARATLAHVPMRFWQVAFPKDVVALTYHIVSDEDLPHLKHYRYKTRAQFEADLALAVKRFKPVTYAQVAAHRLEGARIPARAVLFTFDDGFAECYDVIRPLLLKYGIKGVFFVTTTFLDDQMLFFETKAALALSAVEWMPAEEARERAAAARPLDASRRFAAERLLRESRLRSPATPAHRELMLGLLALGTDDEALIEKACADYGVDVAEYSRRRPLFMTRDQVRRLADDGFTIGGHDLAHRALQRMNTEGIERAIVDTCEAVRDLTGQASVPYAFPYDGIGIDRGLLEGIRKRYPFVGLIFDTQGLRRDAPFMVDRTPVDLPPRDGKRSNVPESLQVEWSYPQAWFRDVVE